MTDAIEEQKSEAETPSVQNSPPAQGAAPAPASPQQNAETARPAHSPTQQRIRRQIFQGMATGRGPKLLRCGDTNWRAEANALKRTPIIVMTPAAKTGKGQQPPGLQILPALSSKPKMEILPKQIKVRTLYHEFPFPMSNEENYQAMRWAMNAEEYDIARIIRDYIDSGYGACEADKFADEIEIILGYPHLHSPLKAVLNAGGDAYGWHGAHLLTAFYNRHIGYTRLLLAAGADPYVINSQELTEARDEGFDSLADSVENARLGLPIMKYLRLQPAPSSASRPFRSHGNINYGHTP